ncbi:MAG: hypothetical protein ACREMY_23400, partial [bacterium]
MNHPLSNVTAIDAGGNQGIFPGFVCASMTSSGEKCWGSNWYGELGIGTSTGPTICQSGKPCSTSPLDVCAVGAASPCDGSSGHGILSNVAGLAAAGQHTCAVITGGTMDCWGWNIYFQIGHGTQDPANVTIPVQVCVASCGSPLTGITNAAGGYASGGYGQTCALKDAGENPLAYGVVCWGWNIDGQLGDNTT